MRATLLHQSVTGSGAVQRLYKLDTPHTAYDGKAYDHVIVSATIVLSTPETYIFGANADGVVLDWCEMDGSYRGGLDHAEALRRAGYEVDQP